MRRPILNDFSPTPWELIDEGLCAQGVYPAEWWFPKRRASASPAVDVCVRCPVRQLCLDYGRESHSVGVWGGVLRIGRSRTADAIVEDDSVLAQHQSITIGSGTRGDSNSTSA